MGAPVVKIVPLGHPVQASIGTFSLSFQLAHFKQHRKLYFLARYHCPQVASILILDNTPQSHQNMNLQHDISK